nr:NAD-dependent epimerase/dehydratase family protein [Variovorax sp. E3]
MTDLVRPVPVAELDEVLRLTAPEVWAELRGQSMFLTGGTGFVGKWLLECLLHAEHVLKLGLTLTVLTREPDRFAQGSPHLANAAAVELLKGDIADFAFPRRPFSSVIHAALPVAPVQSTAKDLERLAMAGARRACELAAASGARRFLHVSSGAVYGSAIGVEAFAEDQPWSEAESANAYTRAKRGAESVVAEGWPFGVVIARCFAFLGPCLQARAVPPRPSSWNRRRAAKASSCRGRARPSVPTNTRATWRAGSCAAWCWASRGAPTTSVAMLK